jgi:hypothetical protein
MTWSVSKLSELHKLRLGTGCGRTLLYLTGEGGQQASFSKGGKVMENMRRLRTHTGYRDWHGWLALQPWRRTAFHLAVVLYLVMQCALVAAQTGIPRVHDHAGIGTEADDPHWSGLVGSMTTMHDNMSAIARTGNADADFVRLMLPHHQAAVDTARVQLLHGKDPQIRRLAQEIITDQQLEIELMQLWLKQHPVSFMESHLTSPAKR